VTPEKLKPPNESLNADPLDANSADSTRKMGRRDCDKVVKGGADFATMA